MTHASTVLIVEDDAALRLALRDNFDYSGYNVLTASTGPEGLDSALTEKPDLIILDIMLPKLNGYEICRQLRQKDIDTPIIMLTAKDQESDLILGLNLGADDYVKKPFSINELLARANAFIRRRTQQHEGRTIQFGAFTINLDSRQLFNGRDEIELTPKEFCLLEYLIEREGRAVTRDQILANVWGDEVMVTQRSVDRCVNTLRSKIEDDSRNCHYLQTVREVGYRFQR